MVPSFLDSVLTSSGTLHAGPAFLVGDAADGGLELVGMVSLELEELGLLGRVGHLGQQIVEDLDGGMLADVCMA